MSGGWTKEDAQHRSDLQQCFIFVHIFTMISVWLLSFLMEAVSLYHSVKTFYWKDRPSFWYCCHLWLYCRRVRVVSVELGNSWSFIMEYNGELNTRQLSTFFIHVAVLCKDVVRLNSVWSVLTDKESFIMNIEHDCTVIGHLKCNVVYSAFCLSQRQLTLVMSSYLCILRNSI